MYTTLGKRATALLLSLICTIALIPVTAYAADPGLDRLLYVVDDIKYDWETAEASVMVERLTDTSTEKHRLYVAAYDKNGRQLTVAAKPITPSDAALFEEIVPITSPDRIDSLKAFVLDGATPVANTLHTGRTIRSGENKVEYSEIPLVTKLQVKNSMVPHASQLILETFPKSFGYLRGARIGVGFGDGNNQHEINGLTNCTPLFVPLTGKTYLSHGTYLNFGNFQQETEDGTSTGKGNGILTPDGRRLLEHTVAHETMHTMMFETTVAGMMGLAANHSINISFNRYPTWFNEGIATVTGGGADWFRNFRLPINNQYVLLENLNAEQVQQLLNSKGYRITDTTTIAKYGTGYMALLYLGSVISGDSSEAGMAAGLDDFIFMLTVGYSMDQAIDTLTAGKSQHYTTLTDFEQRFASEGAAFVLELSKRFKGGAGSLITGDLTDKDLLPNTRFLGNAPLVLELSHTRIQNEYLDDAVPLKGGHRDQTGFARDGSYPADAVPPDLQYVPVGVTPFPKEYQH